MIFELITAEDFREFAEKSPYKSFMQTPEIAELREKNGWTAYFLGVRENGELKAASLLVAKPTFLGKSTFLAPGGPLLDLENVPLTTFFFKNLKNFIKTHNGYTLHIDPYYELKERDRDGKPVETGFNHETAQKTLENLGFKEIESDQPKYLFALDLENKTEDELFASFKQNTRNLISRAIRKNVKIRELEKSDLKILKEITEKTAKRREFEDKPLKYYETMYDLFAAKNEVKFLLAEAEIAPEASRSPQDAPTPPTATPPTSKPTPLSTAMFMTYGDEVIYLFSGSDETYMKEYNAQYLIQWHMIKYAAENGFKRYNFYGIRGLPDPNSEGYGIYRFKKGFGGHVIELIGSYELNVGIWGYIKRVGKSLMRRF